MTYVLELKPEVARAIEAKAVSQGISPEAFLAGFIERFTQSKTAELEEVRRIAEQIFTEHAQVFVALAKSEREDAQALLRASASSEAPENL